ncbi:MAG: prepilin-type N-terminal cleavage/methylation domain-containing protein [Betaproteobacteria bacterium]|nr:prepilin-type N-terminal cleavage/methylation domain-containing protein [Betaproteobacteria bacterium]
MKAAHRQGGFTLIEIAIVLVIIGLLLGGILKGQELITSARVRNLISQQDGIKAAFYGFQDRYRALPGDYQLAAQNLGGTGTISFGNGDGRVQNGVTPVGGSVADEANLVWEHMTRAGFLNGNFTYAAGAPTDASTPKNPYGAFVQLVYDNTYGAGGGPARHNLKTGSQVPVEIMAEVDRKTDDGNPLTGSFVFSAFGGTGTAPTDASCYVAATSSWKLSGATEVNCGGATLL